MNRPNPFEDDSGVNNDERSVAMDIMNRFDK